MERVPERLVRRYGDGVHAWWEALPRELEALAARWELEIGEPVGRGSTSLVMRCRTAAGRAAILKLTPEEALVRDEARALRSWAASGRVPEVWEAEGGALLLEAKSSEATLREAAGADRAAAGEDQATAAGDRAPAGGDDGSGGALARGSWLGDVRELISALHRTGEPAGFPPLSERIEFIFALWIRRAPERKEALERGWDEARRLAQDDVQPVLLHGDLHPGNVLATTPHLTAIDPRACVGDPAFDYVDWAVLYGTDAFDVDPDRLAAWCRALAPMLA